MPTVPDSKADGLPQELSPSPTNLLMAAAIQKKGGREVRGPKASLRTKPVVKNG